MHLGVLLLRTWRQRPLLLQYVHQLIAFTRPFSLTTYVGVQREGSNELIINRLEQLEETPHVGNSQKFKKCVKLLNKLFFTSFFKG